MSPASRAYQLLCHLYRKTLGRMRWLEGSRAWAALRKAANGLASRPATAVIEPMEPRLLLSAGIAHFDTIPVPDDWQAYREDQTNAVWPTDIGNNTNSDFQWVSSGGNGGGYMSANISSNVDYRLNDFQPATLAIWSGSPSAPANLTGMEATVDTKISGVVTGPSTPMVRFYVGNWDNGGNYFDSKDEFAWNPNADTAWITHTLALVASNFTAWPYNNPGTMSFDQVIANVEDIGIAFTGPLGSSIDTGFTSTYGATLGFDNFGLIGGPRTQPLQPTAPCNCGCAGNTQVNTNGMAVITIPTTTIAGQASADPPIAIDSRAAMQSGNNGVGVTSNLPWMQLSNLDDNGVAQRALVIDGETIYGFDKQTNGTWAAEMGGTGSLAQTSGTWTYQDASGNQMAFSATADAADRYELVSSINADGTGLNTVTHNIDGSVLLTTTISSTLTEYSLYTYYGQSDPNAGQLETQTVWRQTTGSNDKSYISQTTYVYYDGQTDTANGSLGDLKSVTLDELDSTTPNVQTVTGTQTSYYRYYTSNSDGGYMHSVKFAVNNDSYQQLALLAAANSEDVTQLPDSTVALYADSAFTYDSEGRVATFTSKGAGCSATCGGMGTVTRTYATSSFADDYNNWTYKCVEQEPGWDSSGAATNTQIVTYANYVDQPIFQATEDGNGNILSADFYAYNSFGEQTIQASTSAINGFSESLPDLVGATYDSNGHLTGGTHLNATGLIQGTDYYPTTDVYGGVAGWQKDTYVQNGKSGSQVLQTGITYIAHIVGGQAFDWTYSTANYANADGTGARSTYYSYQWFAGTNQLFEETVTNPAVLTTEHGSGVATSTSALYDGNGNAIWTMDANGYLTYNEYDPATGAVTKTIADADPTQTTLFTSANLNMLNSAGWTAAAVPNDGSHANLTTTYVLDSQGRTTAETDPNGTITHTFYNDADHEVRTWTDNSNGTPVGSVQITRQVYVATPDNSTMNYAQGFSESLTVALGTGDDPTTVAPFITTADGVTTTNILSMSRTMTNRGGQTVEQQQFDNLNGLTYDYASPTFTLGTAGTNYQDTTYEYNRRGWQKRTQTPDGVITDTIYDNLGRVTSVWAGTDDTPATTGEPWSPTNNGGDMVEVSANVYDNGNVGDGNLTETDTYVAAGQYLATDYGYNWQDEQTSELDPGGIATYSVLDNLGEVTSTQTYANATLNSNGTVSGDLRAETDSSYDELGEVYQTTVDGVNQTTGELDTGTGSTQVTNTWYDGNGNVIMTEDPTGLFTHTLYDGAGRDIEDWTSTAATGGTVVNLTETVYDAQGNVSETLKGTSLANAVVSQKDFYDLNGDGSSSVITPYLTGVATLKAISTLAGTTGQYDADNFVITHYGYNDAGEQDVTLTPAPGTNGPDDNPLPATKSVSTYDLLGDLIEMQTFTTADTTVAVESDASPVSTGDVLLSQSTSDYDSAGRLADSKVYAVSNGVAGDYLETRYGYDALGRQVETLSPSGAFTKTLLNVYGLTLGTFSGVAAGGDALSSSDITADAIDSNDIIATESIPTYDSTGRVVFETDYARSDTSTKLGDLAAGTWSSTDSRRTYSATWYNPAGQVSETANYGTNGGVAMSGQPSSAPATGSLTAIVTDYGYDDFGRNNTVTDNAGHVTLKVFDSAGRTVDTVANYKADSTAGVTFDAYGNPLTLTTGPGNDANQVTQYAYDSAGLMTDQIAYNVTVTLDENQQPVATVTTQDTQYIYAVDLADASGVSPVANGTILVDALYPDSTDTVSADSETGLLTVIGTDHVSHTYNADGSVATSTDQRGVVHTYGYDNLGRQISDIATIPTGSGVDNSVTSIGRVYDDQGRLAKLTSYGPTGGIVNQDVYAYDQWGNVAQSWQSNSGAAVTTGSNQSPSVQYSYADGATNGAAQYVRLASYTTPDGNVVGFTYGDSSTAGQLDQAMGQVQTISYNATTIATYSYLGDGTVAGETRPAVSGGLNLTVTLDNLGNVASQAWTANNSTVLDGYSYTYDASGNRLTRTNQTNSAMNESYTYDNLDRLTLMTRGSGTYSQTWTLDQEGNQSAVSTTANDTTTSQTETNNSSNEITSVSGQANPTYDAAGNMTFDGTDHYTYDAWNRMTAVYADNSGQPGTVIATYSYDATSRRIAETVGSGQSAVTTTFCFNGTRVVQTTSGNQTADYIWDTNGITPICRITSSQPIYFTTDANANVTAIIDGSTGQVIERYVYSAYGQQTIYSSDWTTTLTTSSAGNSLGFASYWQESGTTLDRSEGTRLTDVPLGVWTSPDPAGYIDTTNIYQFCESNPENSIDPSGLYYFTITGDSVTYDSNFWDNPKVSTHVAVKTKSCIGDGYRTNSQIMGWRGDWVFPKKVFDRLEVAGTTPFYPNTKEIVKDLIAHAVDNGQMDAWIIVNGHCCEPTPQDAIEVLNRKHTAQAVRAAEIVLKGAEVEVQMHLIGLQSILAGRAMMLTDAALLRTSVEAPTQLLAAQSLAQISLPGSVAVTMSDVQLYRVFGGDSLGLGQYYTTVNPGSALNYRSAAGLYPQNSGQFVLEGTLGNTEGVIFRTAAPGPSGLGGGLPEVFVPTPLTQMNVFRVSGANPPF